MGAGRRQREKAAVEKYQLEFERGKHPKSPKSEGSQNGLGHSHLAMDAGMLLQGCGGQRA